MDLFVMHGHFVPVSPHLIWDETQLVLEINSNHTEVGVFQMTKFNIYLCDYAQTKMHHY